MGEFSVTFFATALGVGGALFAEFIIRFQREKRDRQLAEVRKAHVLLLVLDEAKANSQFISSIAEQASRLMDIGASPRLGVLNNMLDEIFDAVKDPDVLGTVTSLYGNLLTIQTLSEAYMLRARNNRGDLALELAELADKIQAQIRTLEESLG